MLLYLYLIFWLMDSGKPKWSQNDFLPTWDSVSKNWKAHCKVLSLYMCAHSVVSDSSQPHGDCSPPGSSVHGISQERILEWIAFPTIGNIPHPGLNQHWKGDSLPLSHQGSPIEDTYKPLNSPIPLYPVWKHQQTELGTTVITSSICAKFICYCLLTAIILSFMWTFLLKWKKTTVTLTKVLLPSSRDYSIY